MRHRLDLHLPVGPAPERAAVVIFFHGGGFVAGERALPDEPFFANLADRFACDRVLAVKATYWLAPEIAWRESARDVAYVLGWGQSRPADVDRAT